MSGLAPTKDSKGVYTNTHDVDCAVCKCDLHLSAVVALDKPGLAVCPEHAAQLGAAPYKCTLLVRWERHTAAIRPVPRHLWVRVGAAMGGLVAKARLKASSVVCVCKHSLAAGMLGSMLTCPLASSLPAGTPWSSCSPC